MVETPLQDDVQRFTQLLSLEKQKKGRFCRYREATQGWFLSGGKKKNLRRIHLILKIRKDDIEMYQHWQEGAAACLGFFMILHRNTEINSTIWNISTHVTVFIFLFWRGLFLGLSPLFNSDSREIKEGWRENGFHLIKSPGCINTGHTLHQVLWELTMLKQLQKLSMCCG